MDPRQPTEEVNFTFQREREDESLRWVLYERGRYVPFAVPAVGGRAAIEAVAFNLLSPPTSRVVID